LDTFRITPYERHHRQKAVDLLFFSRRVNTHLDWQDSSRWLAAQTGVVWLAWDEEKLVGLVAASSPMDGVSWLRLVIVSDDVAAKSVLVQIWRVLVDALRAQSCHTVMVLAAEIWLLDYLSGLGFVPHEEIITLTRKSQPLPAREPASGRISSAEMTDLESIVSVDALAFAPLWHMTPTDMRQAVRLVAIATVARLDARIVGFQLSTMHDRDGHLARLAVIPEIQGQGIGSALLYDLIQRLDRRDVKTLTVNTQRSNQRSLRVYERYGFVPNGYNLLVWKAQLQDQS
jgi:GNAT superfamily N-acetyltransferase